MITGLFALFQSILVSSLLALLLSPGLIITARRFGLMDQPGSAHHKLHKSATPMAGGLVILLSGFLAIMLLPIEIPMELLGILLGCLLVSISGLLDDATGLKPIYKLAGQILASVIVISFGTQVHITRIEWLDLCLTLLWLVGISNAFNFVDSMDGLAVGLAGIAAAFFMLVSVDSRQPELAGLSAITLGIMIGMFVYTSPPARMFLGDSGSQLLGMLLAAIGIAYTPGQAGLPQAATWFTPILVLGVPIFDMVLVILSRLTRGQPIYRANTDHLYHRLTLIGFHPNRSVLIMQVAAIVLSLVAFLALNASVLLANLMFAGLIFLAAGGLIYLEIRYRQMAAEQPGSA